MEVNESKFAMWRCAVAIAYIDGKLDYGERNLLEDYFYMYNFSEKQRNQLFEDLAEGVKLDDVLPLVTDKADSLHLINLSRIIVYADDQYCDDEKNAVIKIRKHHAPNEEYIEAEEKHDVLDYNKGTANNLIKYSSSFLIE